MPYNTRRGGSRVSPDPRSGPSHTRSPPLPRRLEDNFTDDDPETSEDEEVTGLSAVNRKRTRKNPAIHPTMQNYHELGLEWGQARAERILARQPHIKTRVSQTCLLEAQALQFQYNLDKTMLCIAEGISRPTLDAALYDFLLLSPLIFLSKSICSYIAFHFHTTDSKGHWHANQINIQTIRHIAWLVPPPQVSALHSIPPNRYDLHLTPSRSFPCLCIVPPKGQSAGFKQRNKIVGNTWSSYEEDQQHVFKPEIFERLISEVMKEMQYNRSEPPMTTSTEDDELSIDLTLTDEEKEKYVPIFKSLVNMEAVKLDFKHGRLCRHSGTARQFEKVGIEEIKKVVEQLNLIHTKFRFHFHLLVAAWNPNTSMSRALYQDEFTSAETWAGLARSEFHLLERFAVASTQAPAAKKSTKKSTESSTPQAILRQDLITRLNGLIRGRESRNDTHPQGPNPHVTLPKRTFRSGIRLAVLRLPGSLVTEDMLSRGCGAGKLPGEKVRLWIEDIVAKRYLVVKATDPRLNTSTDMGQPSTATTDMGQPSTVT
ncbi:uncharacterized protein MELLADRAFT_58354 [Melampsora larici-populina 98AG31]|uniref:Uncharacterized protein n=1 Tax=Melampsora larici-populina (strain 98AG31 / pathotype 3-4-7) TaxID=747676 RepID=F4R369_MELLP|nr:uncharacterized protein MELLADRAFT_58354 [Melampsora larici-populina 98AG31]EGG13221.1 hypothetical protein MELLADRAFT_58354 [Melampsora larici-populina 98AG31]